MVSALVVCAVVLQNNDLGSIPNVYNYLLWGTLPSESNDKYPGKQMSRTSPFICFGAHYHPSLMTNSLASKCPELAPLSALGHIRA